MSAGAAAWSEALLEQLLPARRAGRTVVLACDDEALAAAGERIGVAGDPLDDLRRSLAELGPLDRQRGLEPALAQLTGPPADLCVLCLCVLAASRMSPDERAATHAYYIRLAQVLDIGLREVHPKVAGMSAIPARFRALADWLRGPEQGRRGELALSEHSHLRLIWSPISQVLLRRVDRERLGRFFSLNERSLDLGRDPLRLLLGSPVRHELTGPAQTALRRGELAGPLRASIAAAYAAWDGTLLDERGERAVPAALRLGYSPGRATLNLSLPRAESEQILHGPDGPPLRVPPTPRECLLPLAWLAYARSGPVELRPAGEGPRVRALSGQTLLFGADETGFWQVDGAGEEPVTVLTCDPQLTGGDWRSRLARCELPAGWQLIFDVEATDLPEELRRATATQRELGGADVWLCGGLALEERTVFLSGHPPRVHGMLAEPAVVELLGPGEERRQVGELLPGEPFELDQLAGDPGSYRIEVSGSELCFELVGRGMREGVGRYALRPEQPALARAGAIDDAAAELLAPAGARVCGAAVDGRGTAGWRPPLCVRAQATVKAIDADGTVRVCRPPAQPQWARHAGISAGGPWEIPDGGETVWLCVASRQHPRVLAVRELDVEPTNPVLDLAEDFAAAPVISRGVPGAPERWRALVEIAFEDEEARTGA